MRFPIYMAVTQKKEETKVKIPPPWREILMGIRQPRTQKKSPTTISIFIFSLRGVRHEGEEVQNAFFSFFPFYERKEKEKRRGRSSFMSRCLVIERSFRFLPF